MLDCIWRNWTHRLFVNCCCGCCWGRTATRPWWSSSSSRWTVCPGWKFPRWTPQRHRLGLRDCPGVSALTDGLSSISKTHFKVSVLIANVPKSNVNGLAFYFRPLKTRLMKETPGVTEVALEKGKRKKNNKIY